MAAEILTCPFCNSSVTLLRPGTSGQRLRCPRCHELIPYPGGEGARGEGDNAAPDWAATEHAFGDRVASPFRRRWSNRSVALVILSVMATMAVLGFTFAWFTTEIRRQRDLRTEPSFWPRSEVRSVSPAKLEALGYLPAGTNAIAGIHVAELMARPETASILRRMRRDQANIGIYRLEQSTGLTLEDLDHVLLGLKLNGDAVGRIFLIVQTRQPYDVDNLLDRLHAGQAFQRAGKMVHPITPEETALGGVVWCAGPRTLVFALYARHLDSVPAEPIAGVDRFAADIQKPLQGLEEGTQAWMIGSLANWDSILPLLFVLGLPHDDLQMLTRVHAFRGWLRCDKEIHGQIEVTCTNEAGALELEKYLTRKGLEPHRLEQLKEEQPRADALLAELAQSLVRKRQGERLQFQGKVSLESVRQLFPQRSAGARTVR